MSRIIRGLAAENAYNDVKRKKKMENKTCNQDIENRKELVKKVNELMKNGKSFDEAVDCIMDDEIMQAFDYWTKNNLDVKQCIANLVKSYTNTKLLKGQER